MKLNNDLSAVSVLQRTKQDDGSYIITLPVNTSEEVYTDVNTGEILSDRLIDIKNTESTLLDDMTELLLKLSPMVSGSLQLNHIYKEDFRSMDNIELLSGEFAPGSIQGERLSFQLKNGIHRTTQPKKIKVKDVKNIEANASNVSVYITVNFEDINVYWMDCTEAYLNKQDIDIPYLEEKEDNRPWSVNVKFVFKSNTIPVSVSDLIIAHI